MRTALVVLRKDLLLELRTLETLPAMALFSLSVFVIFHFALGQQAIHGQEAAGVLIATLLLAAMLGVNRLFVAEREQGGFDAFLLAPLFAFMVALEIVALPAFALLLLGPSLGPSLGGVLGVLALANVGIAVIGTLVSAIAVQTRARDLIGPIIALPIQIPPLIAAARALAPLVVRDPPSSPPGEWLLLLALYDLVFALIAYAVFDFLLED
jgi:heme exporter protein B